jgi:hypothetical protein
MACMFSGTWNLKGQHLAVQANKAYYLIFIGILILQSANNCHMYKIKYEQFNVTFTQYFPVVQLMMWYEMLLISTEECQVAIGTDANTHTGYSVHSQHPQMV